MTYRLTAEHIIADWTRLDIYCHEERDFGEVRDKDEQRNIYTDGHGSIVEVQPDGTVAPLVMRNPIPDDAPWPMMGETERNGVIGYMCKIDFECELGGTDAVIRTSAEKALCAGTCGVVEVEIIGRRIIIEEKFDDMDEDALEAHVAEARAKLQAIDAERNDG